MFGNKLGCVRPGGAFVSHWENNFPSEDFEFVALYCMIISTIALRNPEQLSFNCFLGVVHYRLEVGRTVS